MQFQVPQFIEVEDKIFGPLTWKQFIYLAGGGGIVVILFYFLPRFMAIIIALPVVAFSVALAFYKVNNRPFINVVESMFKFYIGSRLYIWRKTDKKITPSDNMSESNNAQIYVPKLSDSKLKDLNWTLGVKKGDSDR